LPFAGLDLTGVDYVPFGSNQSINHIPLETVVTPVFAKDAAGVEITEPFGKRKTKIVMLDDKLTVRMNYLLGCPLASPAVLANQDKEEYLHCVITDDTVNTVYKETLAIKKPLPKFKAVSEGQRAIPVGAITANNVAHYAPMFTKMGFAPKADTTIGAQLKALGFSYLPVKYPLPATSKEVGVWSPKVAVIEFLA